jgi:hypothetical protein
VRGTHVLRTQTERQVRARKYCKPSALTSWRAQTERQVRTRNECELMRGTHELESPDRETSQTQKECETARGTHVLQSPDGDKSGHEGHKSVRGTHFLENQDGETSQGTDRMRTSERHSPTGSPDIETSQDTGRMRASEGHSHPREPRRRGKSRYRKDASQRRALTNCRVQVGRHVRTRKECETGRGTHVLESPDRGTSQDRERM